MSATPKLYCLDNEAKHRNLQCESDFAYIPTDQGTLTIVCLGRVLYRVGPSADFYTMGPWNDLLTFLLSNSAWQQRSVTNSTAGRRQRDTMHIRRYVAALHSHVNDTSSQWIVSYYRCAACSSYPRRSPSNMYLYLN